MTKGEQARLTAWRLRVLRQAADEQNVARVCRRFGISRKSFYQWKRRHVEHGDAGLCDLMLQTPGHEKNRANIAAALGFGQHECRHEPREDLVAACRVSHPILLIKRRRSPRQAGQPPFGLITSRATKGTL